MATDTTTPEQDETTETFEITEDTAAETPEAPEETEQTEEEPETFPRAYVEKLRRESAGYRDKAKRADELGERLQVALVEATGRLADATDLPYAPEYLDDPAALTEALEALLKAKPHLASRRPVGDVGQGASAGPAGFSLADVLRAGAN